MSKKEIIHLQSKYYDQVGYTPWNEYPRPRLKRNSFINLNGKWKFEITKENVKPVFYSQNILVPFCVESLLSGITKQVKPNDYLHYRKEFAIKKKKDERVILHIGGVDGICKIYLNNIKILTRNPSYLPIDIDITNSVLDDNVLDIVVIDNLDKKYPYGKQCNKRGGMWYTPVSGIWQTVWLEIVPNEYIKDVNVDVKENVANISITPKLNGTIYIEGKKHQLIDGNCDITIGNPIYWSPDNPYLYNFEIKTKYDSVSSYFAIRKLSTYDVNGVKRLCLNGKPYFFNGLLDQGYYSDGIFTPATPKAYEDDILLAKSLGFNTLRKHIKVEPDIFYYYCDKLGMIVFQDMVNNGSYDFMFDTALPTVIPKIKINDKMINLDKETRQNFVEHMKGTISYLKFHPSICYWTIFNEGWGQFSSDEMYLLVKDIDDTRFIDSTSGWFSQNNSDVNSLHIYFRDIKPIESDKPIVISECGGYSYKVNNHISNYNSNYGYGSCKTREQFVLRFTKFYEEQILPYNNLSGCIYTQLSDVEDETNGLVTYDREQIKVLPNEIVEIMDKIREK